MFLPIGSKVTVENLIKGIIIQSGNDACIVAAENIAGSEEDFAELMNAKAKELGLKIRISSIRPDCRIRITGCRRKTWPGWRRR